MRLSIRYFWGSKYFLIPVAALLFYTLTGFFLAPLALRWYVPKYAHDRLQSQALLGKVRINPFLLSFEADEFSLIGPDNAPLAGFEKLSFDLELSNPFNRTVVLREFRLEKPSLQIVLDSDGHLNLAGLVPPAAKPEPAPPSESKPSGLILRTLTVTGGEVSITDRRRNTEKSFNFHNLELSINSLSTLENQKGAYSFSAATPREEKVQLQGEIALAPLFSSGKLTCVNLQAAGLWEFARESLNLDSPEGTLDISADYRLEAKKDAPFQFLLENIHLDLSEVSLKLADADKSFLELNKLELSAARFDPLQRVLEISNLLVDGGTLQLHVDQAGRTNLERLVKKAPGEEKPTPAQEGASPPIPEAWRVDIDTLEIKDIAFHLEDLSRALPLRAEASGISLSSGINIYAGLPRTKVSFHEISTDLKEVRLGTFPAAKPLFRAGRIKAEGGELDLAERSFILSGLELSEGHLDVGRAKDGQINWAQLFAAKDGASSKSGQKPAPVSRPPWKFLLKTIGLTGFSSALSDSLQENPLYNLQDIKLLLTQVDGKSPMTFDVSLRAEQGGSAALRGKVDPSTMSIEANCKVAGWMLSPLQPYLAPYMTLILQSASVSSEGLFRYGLPSSGAGLLYEGSFALDKLSLAQPGSSETYLGWSAMQIPQMKLTLQPNELQIGEIKWIKPTGQFIIFEDKSVNLSKILKEETASHKPPASAPTVSSKSTEPFPFSIGKVRVEDGNVIFADLSMEPQFMTRIQELKGTATKLSSVKDTLAQIQLDGNVDQYGYARISGVLDLYNFKRSADIDMIFRNIELTSINPYSGRFAGRKIKSGKLSMDLKYQIQDSKLVGDNKIIVDNLVLGEHVESSQAVNLPLDLAIALLTDSKGRIDIGLPVSGDLTDPKFSLGSIIWKALSGVLTKAVTAPFRALGSLFGEKAEKIDAVEFDPGKAELLPPEKEKLKKISEALQKRPQLKLIVQGHYSPEADGVELKQLSVRRAVADRLGEKLTPDDDPGPLDYSDSKTQSALKKISVERAGAPALAELNRAVSEGTLKPRASEAQSSAQGKAKKKRGLLSRVLQRAKLYKIVPGMKSPEQSELLAVEIYTRLVESEPLPEKDLLQLAIGRAQAIGAELQSACGIPAERIITRTPELAGEDAGLSAKLTFDTLR